jgi:hypothetical protein
MSNVFDGRFWARSAPVVPAAQLTASASAMVGKRARYATIANITRLQARF